jgi:hypothetical protein
MMTCWRLAPLAGCDPRPPYKNTNIPGNGTMHRPTILGLGTFVVAMTMCSATTLAADGPPIATELLNYLGLPAGTQHAVLDQCKVAHTGMSSFEKLPEEVVAVGAMVLVDANNVGEVVDAFLKPTTFEHVHQATRTKVAATSDGFPPPRIDPARLASKDVDRIVRDSAAALNLSAQELPMFRDLATARDRRAALAADIGTVMVGRLDSFAVKGVAGIAPYTRDDGDVVSPAKELDSAIRSLGILGREFPDYVERLRDLQPAENIERQLHWIEVPFGDARVWALGSEVRKRYADRAIGTDMHFYVSNDYNAMLTTVGIVPYGSRWLVFAINHTYTDQVTGFGSSLKHSVARKKVAQRLAEHLEAARKTLPMKQGCNKT